MKNTIKLAALFLSCLFSAQEVQQDVETEVIPFKNSLGELKVDLDKSGDKFIKFGLSSQVWLRSIENNPGTLVNDVPQEQTYDAGLRRMRVTMNAQLSNSYSIFMQMGINNQSFISGGGTGTGANGQGKKPQIFFMDAYNEFAIKPRKNSKTGEQNENHLYVGAGLHGWSGVSRLTNASTTKLLTADLPVLNFPNIEVSDQFARQLGIFAHGDYKKFNYRVSINKPFATNKQPGVNEIVENNQSGKLSYAGYGMYQFWDKENTSTSFLAGTYLGSKKIFNIGAGFYTTKDATRSQPEVGVYKSHSQTVLGADLFVERPIGRANKEMSVSFYSVFYHLNFGPNYLRMSGIMNPGTKDPNFAEQVALEGFGNSKALLGSGNMWFTQAGFVIPKFSEAVKLQPFAAYTLKNLEGLNQSGHYYDLGMNLFVRSQNAKIAYQYSSRPLYSTDTKTVFSRRGEHLLTLQIAL